MVQNANYPNRLVILSIFAGQNFDISRQKTGSFAKLGEFLGNHGTVLVWRYLAICGTIIRKNTIYCFSTDGFTKECGDGAL
ncbi:MAG: hypothetical protein RI946_1941 [Pseudomonadota bacterium]